MEGIIMRKLLSAMLLAGAGTLLAASSGAAQGQITTCKGEEATIVGTSERDVLVGTSDRDVIIGLGRADVIRAAGGNDLVCGGHGEDRISGASGADKLFGRAQNDFLRGGAGSDRLVGGTRQDTMIGGAGSGDACLGGRPLNDHGALKDEADYETCERIKGSGRLTAGSN